MAASTRSSAKAAAAHLVLHHAVPEVDEVGVAEFCAHGLSS